MALAPRRALLSVPSSSTRAVSIGPLVEGVDAAQLVGDLAVDDGRRPWRRPCRRSGRRRRAARRPRARRSTPRSARRPGPAPRWPARTSTSTVGLPRESRISRPCTCTISLIGVTVAGLPRASLLRMDLQLTGKRAIVTGGSKGIGKADRADAGRRGVRRRRRRRGPRRRSRRRPTRSRPRPAAASSPITVDTGEDASVRALVATAPPTPRRHRHPRQQRRQAARPGAAAEARRRHRHAVLGRHERQGARLPALRPGRRPGDDRPGLGPDHQRLRASAPAAPARSSARCATSPSPR